MKAGLLAGLGLEMAISWGRRSLFSDNDKTSLSWRGQLQQCGKAERNRIGPCSYPSCPQQQSWPTPFQWLPTLPEPERKQVLLGHGRVTQG